ncbi:hypothetical protein V1260_15440 [Brachybacterium sp. J144]|uniref:hypothetical protein n=1 Tax=Brachybacterium sp. J144 TaxID=3116487 RepID=UPI002E77F49F|nr:hypothetical protein [Brachybacterium sp. J144]MEE1652175.1 hypothetical protein [Brachybacterium sp. J144]
MVPPEYGGRLAVGKYGEPGVSPHTPTTLPPETSWSLTAPVIAGQPRMRLAKPQRENRVSYPASTERALSPALPAKPAAVRLYSDAGQCNVLALDFDAKDRTTEQIDDVAYDVFQAEALLDQAGAWFLTDHAHGGSHVYVLLEHALPFIEARELVEAMAQRWETLDPSPHQSIARGCITVPGSAHKLGGHRQLTISERSLRERINGLRTPARAVRQLRLNLRDEIRLVQAKRAATVAAEPHSTPVVYNAGAGRVMGHKYLALALEGDWAAYGYDSPSEARWAVLWSAMATGLSREDVATRMNDGRWPGLWALHAHRPRPWRAFADDWSRMEALFRAKNDEQEDSGHTSDTSANSHTGEPSVHDSHGSIRAWRSLLHEVETREFPGARGWTRRLLLRAIAKQSHEIGSTLTATGVRGLSLATGLSIQTVAALLRELSTQHDPWITLIARAHGREAAAYALRIPDRYADAAATVRWIRGKAHALRPVFERLGAPAALTYEAIEHGHGSSPTTIQARTGLSRTAVTDALATLTGWNLIDGNPDEGYWLTSDDTHLERLAERLGVTHARATKLATYREHRRIWWAYLARHDIALHAADLEADREILALLDEMRLNDLDPPPHSASTPARQQPLQGVA